MRLLRERVQRHALASHAGVAPSGDGGAASSGFVTVPAPEDNEPTARLRRLLAHRPPLRHLRPDLRLARRHLRFLLARGRLRRQRRLVDLRRRLRCGYSTLHLTTAAATRLHRARDLPQAPRAGPRGSTRALGHQLPPDLPRHRRRGGGVGARGRAPQRRAHGQRRARDAPGRRAGRAGDVARLQRHRGASRRPSCRVDGGRRRTSGRRRSPRPTAPRSAASATGRDALAIRLRVAGAVVPRAHRPRRRSATRRTATTADALPGGARRLQSSSTSRASSAASAALLPTDRAQPRRRRRPDCARAYFDGDPFPADNQMPDGEATAHDRALAVMKLALVDLDRLHCDPASGVLADAVSFAGAAPTARPRPPRWAPHTLPSRSASRAAALGNLTPTATPPRRRRHAHRPRQDVHARRPNARHGRAAPHRPHQRRAEPCSTGSLPTTGAHCPAIAFATMRPTAQEGALEDYAARVSAGCSRPSLTTGDLLPGPAPGIVPPMESVIYRVDDGPRGRRGGGVHAAALRDAPVGLRRISSSRRRSGPPGTFARARWRATSRAAPQARAQRLGRPGDDDNVVDWPAECVSVVAGTPRGGLQPPSAHSPRDGFRPRAPSSTATATASPRSAVNLLPPRREHPLFPEGAVTCVAFAFAVALAARVRPRAAPVPPPRPHAGPVARHSSRSPSRPMASVSSSTPTPTASPSSIAAARRAIARGRPAPPPRPRRDGAATGPHVAPRRALPSPGAGASASPASARATSPSRARHRRIIDCVFTRGRRARRRARLARTSGPSSCRLRDGRRRGPRRRARAR